MTEAATAPWGPDSGWTITFHPDERGPYRVEGLANSPSATVTPESPDHSPTPRCVSLRPTIPAHGPFGLEGILTVRFYVCPDGMEQDLLAFEKETQSVYYPFMAEFGWRYGGLCDVRSQFPSICCEFAEIHSVLAPDRATAEAMDAKSKPEPAHITAMYEKCSAYAVKGTSLTVWLIPR